MTQFMVTQFMVTQLCEKFIKIQPIEFNKSDFSQIPKHNLQERITAFEVYFIGDTRAMMVDGVRTQIEFGGNLRTNSIIP